MNKNGNKNMKPRNTGEKNSGNQNISNGTKVPALIIGGALLGNLLVPGIGGAIIGGVVGGIVGRTPTTVGKKEDK